jgi:uncharacterized repeat protein (TIGR03987 family)
MKPILIAGTGIVNLALISYTIYIFYERKTRRTGNKVLAFLTAGITFDIIATTCMIIGSSRGAFTLHGILGYSSLLGMLADAFLTWRSRIKNGPGSELKASLHKYALIAYIWWIIAYLTGFVLVMAR